MPDGPVERYLYDPYGRVTFLKPDWSLQQVDDEPEGTESAFGNEILCTGYRWNPAPGMGTYHARFRGREYHPLLGRFMQRDPLGYVDGGNLYAGYFVRWGGVDPMGLLSVAELPDQQTRFGNPEIIRSQESSLRRAERGARDARMRADMGLWPVANDVDPYNQHVVTEYDYEALRDERAEKQRRLDTIAAASSKEKQCCGGVTRGHRVNLRCCGNSNDGQWYDPDRDCCESERMSTYDPYGPFLTADGSNPIFWMERRVVAKVSLWVCERPLAGVPWLAGYGGGMPWSLRPTHSYICCDGPNRNCYGKQSGTRAGGRISREPLATGDCQQKKVCPAVKRDKCIFPVATYDYTWFSRNCHVWAWRGL
ncbi:MAG: hypothetical protein JJU36_10185 [Phycisphaeraceae bacterium]|nr:hypothetical protein [Phycisphaeraceae bacterium]